MERVLEDVILVLTTPSPASAILSATDLQTAVMITTCFVSNTVKPAIIITPIFLELEVVVVVLTVVAVEVILNIYV